MNLEDGVGVYQDDKGLGLGLVCILQRKRSAPNQVMTESQGWGLESSAGQNHERQSQSCQEIWTVPYKEMKNH